MAKWWLLSLGSWILFNSAAIGILVLAFHVAENALMEDILGLVSAAFLVSAIPYLILLAILMNKVMARLGANHQVESTLVLAPALSIPALLIHLTALELLLGLEISARPIKDLLGIAVAASVLFAHARFSLRLASSLSGSTLSTVIWCFLSLASWAAFGATSVGIFAVAFRVTENALMDDLSGFLPGAYFISAIPYHILFAILGARVMERTGPNHRPGLTILLTLLLSWPAMFIGATELALSLGIEFLD